MYFSNEFLYDFKPVYEGILAAKSVKPECAIVEVIDEELEYKIVGSTEANSLKGKISNESPVGKALLGKQVGDTVFFFGLLTITVL